MAGFDQRFDRALALAHSLHREQLRKGSEVPYIGHLLGVAALVIDDGGSEDEAIAALLHDAAEDQGGEETLDRIEQEFGTEVRGMVDELSDTLVDPKPPWRERKEAYLAHLANASRGTKRISLADKLYNARAILADHRRVGEQVWERFSASREDTLWYYRSLGEIFSVACPGALAEELETRVEEMEALAG